MEEVEEMDCPGLEEAVAMASMRERLMQFEAQEKVWNETMEHVLKTMFATNLELSELQTTHKNEMQKHEVETTQLTSQLAKIKADLKFRTKACNDAQRACPLMLQKINDLKAQNARQAAELADLREQNARLTRVVQACQLMDE